MKPKVIITIIVILLFLAVLTWLARDTNLGGLFSTPTPMVTQTFTQTPTATFIDTPTHAAIPSSTETNTSHSPSATATPTLGPIALQSTVRVSCAVDITFVNPQNMQRMIEFRTDNSGVPGDVFLTAPLVQAGDINGLSLNNFAELVNGWNSLSYSGLDENSSCVFWWSSQGNAVGSIVPYYSVVGGKIGMPAKLWTGIQGNNAFEGVRFFVPSQDPAKTPTEEKNDNGGGGGVPGWTPPPTPGSTPEG